MNEIRVLDKATIDKIAAGEVVERPSSVVKELVENSIDSGATALSIEIKGGGMELIRVTDNGSGIPKDQVRTAVLRHATSKIRNAEDLSFIHTLGFRGEALSSIAAVSDMEICTKTAGSSTGVIYKICAGEEKSLKEAGLPDGTTIMIRELFKNVPARLKFLGTAAKEAGKVSDIVEKIVLSHPEVAVKFTVNGSVRLSSSGNGSLKDAIYAVYGRDIASNLLDVSGVCGMVSLNGFIGKPEIARGNRNFEVCFINGRYVKDKVVSYAIEEAYKGYQMKGTYPFACLNIKLEPELVDVNVHPAKMEVRFYDSLSVSDSIFNIISDVIKNRENIPGFTVESKEPAEPAKEDYISLSEILNMTADECLSEESSYGSASRPGADIPLRSGEKLKDMIPEPFETKRLDLYSAPEPVYEQQSFFDGSRENFLSENSRAGHRIIGQVFGTYWIVESDDSIYIIDQHAAHEKVLYESFMEKIRNGTLTSQLIAPALIVSLTQAESEVLEKYADEFERLGFEIRSYGASDYAITAVPADLYSLNSKDLFLSFIDEMTEVSSGFSSEMLSDRVATAACKAAVKGRSALSVREADELIDHLLMLDNPYNCPHGRPTIITMSRYELEKKFKRII